MLPELVLPVLVLPVLVVPVPVALSELPLDVVGVPVDEAVLESHVVAEVGVAELDELAGAVVVDVVVVFEGLLGVAVLPSAAGGAVAVVQAPLAEVSALVVVVFDALEDPDSRRRFTAAAFRSDAADRGRARLDEFDGRLITAASVPEDPSASRLIADWTVGAALVGLT